MNRSFHLPPLRGKKGIGDFLIWTVRILAISLVFTFLAIYVNGFITGSISTDALEAQVFVARILNAPGGFSYTDSASGVFSPGTIDVERFSMVLLDEVVLYPADTVSAQFSLYAEDDMLLATTYYNKPYYDRWSPWADFERESTGRVFGTQKQIYVRMKTENGFSFGKLVIKVVMPLDR